MFVTLAGMTMTRAEYDEELRESLGLYPQLEYRGIAGLDGDSDEGITGVIWNVTVTGSCEGHPDEDDLGGVAVAKAVLYWYPNAKDDRNFAMDMDSSDHPITLLGSDVVQPGPPYEGIPRPDLFPLDDENLTDLLLIGEFEIDEVARGMGVMESVVRGASTMFGRNTAAVILCPDPTERVDWIEHGFEPAGGDSDTLIFRTWPLLVEDDEERGR